MIRGDGDATLQASGEKIQAPPPHEVNARIQQSSLKLPPLLASDVPSSSFKQVPPISYSNIVLGHKFALPVSEKGKSVILAEVDQPVEKLGLGVPASKVFDGSSQPAASSISVPTTSLSEVNATTQRTDQIAAQQFPDVPSSSHTVLSSQHQDRRSKHTQVWIESKGSKALKSQLQNTSCKDKALSIANSFSVLDVEQKEGLFKEFHSDFQKVLQMDKVEGSAALEVCSSGAEYVVAPADVSSSEQTAELAPVDTMTLVENEAIPQDALVVPNSNLADFVQPSHLGSIGKAGPRQIAIEVCSSGAVIEVAPADVTSSGQIGEPAPVGIMTQVSILTSTTPPKSWANMVEEEEQEAKKIALLKAKTVDIRSSKLVQSSGPDTIKDHITNPGKANFNERVAQKDHNEGLALKNKTKTAKRVDTKRYISQDDSQVDEIKFTQDNPLTDLPPEESKCFISSEGNMMEFNEYQEAGYRLIARRSLFPTGMPSPKLISLRKKVEYIHICEESTTLKNL
ncbi:hypothetical protein LIER_09738 [Lithospermum erythrorhizon]|uniref:Uncharacterized protein n=1 Tax=Lithospermum erythrorhizon TaxID=34254 RepID=A0AAV3PJ49_LITER